ncbi:MAG: hypothetical protein HY782_11190 [Chloroflexi bacterium]|nr:hypothetical protein [Chloroflexota bacterium]
MLLQLFRRSSLLLLVSMLAIGCGPAFGSAPATPVGQVVYLQPFLQPDANHEPVLSAIKAAKKSIRMEMHLLNDKDVIDALKRARGRGVDVRVIVESQPLGAGAGNKPAIAELQQANIGVKTGNPAYPLTHSKVIVIDETTALIMTLDQTRAAFSTNREFGIIDSDPDDVAEILAVLDADWNRQPVTVTNPNLVWGPVNSRARLLALMDSATRTLDIEAEQMQDDEIADRLIAAVQRGVAVRVIMSPSLSGPDPNAAGREKIKRGGVGVRLVKTPYMHARMIVADNARGFIGSQGFSPAALDLNRELGLLTTNKRVVDGLAATFYADWNIAK